MVVIKFLPGVGQIEIVIGKDTPGDGTDPVEIVPGDPILGGSRLQNAQLLQFLVKTQSHRLGRIAGCHASLKALGIRGPVVLGDTQLPLDNLHLLLEKELPLIIGNLFVDLSADLPLQLGDLLFPTQQLQHLGHARGQGQGLENGLQLLTRGCGHGSSEVRQQAGLVGIEIPDVVLQLFGVQGVQGQQFLDSRDNGHGIGLYFIALPITLGPRVLHLGNEWPIGSQPPDQSKAPHALGNELTRLVLVARRAVQPDHAAHVGKVLGSRFRGTDIADESQAQQSRALLRHRLQGVLPLVGIQADRLHLAGEERSPRQGQQHQGIR